ncbi:ParB/RepB/Spo0J family partition protein [Photobacterium leiognathi]|uniref:ParB/RepB/Spo0J family partition protein n=1 Tax=Photobacterium leiognathi TaxID=553611 RepID=UPI00020880E0|nr:ParB/RepB/Spo0J family partition protein [Photobacterium leiognathi]PSW48320.1 ParB/RepB/Spo0J family partition protein [Photobacterium leiognathi subsp. mandapamensis]GAA03248.1 parB-like partition s domain protein [Photobacterium leiognathi subsp. mandapamensis svers.1.1.]
MKNDLSVDITPTSVSVSVAAAQKKPLAKALTKKVGTELNHPVKGEMVTFKLKKVDAEWVERSTQAWVENERDQDLLTESALDDVLNTFIEHGQQVPAFGRETNGVIEVADGSRRRMAAIITGSDYYIWVGELTPAQMTYLSETGNQHKPTSAYERGKNYKRKLRNSNKSELAELIGVDRKIITRCINTAQLPSDFVACFSSPNELSARKGDSLFKFYEKLTGEQTNALNDICAHWLKEKKEGTTRSADDLVAMFTNACAGGVKSNKKAKPEPRQLAMGATLLVNKGNATFNLPNVSNETLEIIEAFISKTLSDDALKNC